MKNKLINIAIIIFLMSCGSSSENNTAAEPLLPDNTVSMDSVQFTNAGIVIGEANIKQMHKTLKVNGMVDVPPQSLVSVSFPLGGYLNSTPLLPGMHVNKGQVLGVMEDQSYVQLQQDYLTAKTRMEYLEADMQRQKELSDADAASKKNYQLVLSEYKTQQVIIRALEEKLRIIHINPESLHAGNISRTVPVYAPITGFVTKVNVNIGRYVNPVDVLFELVNPDDIHAAITVFEKDITSFKKGVKGKVYLNDRPDLPHDVEVILVTMNIDDDRTGLVHCHFENPDHSMLPGMYLNGVFELSSETMIAVPEEAIVRYMGNEYVFSTSDNKTFKFIQVFSGMKDAGFAEIKDTANLDLLDKKIAVKGAYALLGKLKNKMED